MSILEKITSDKELDSNIVKVISLVSLMITVTLFWLPIYRVGRSFLVFDLSQIPFINELPFSTVPLDLKPGLRAGVIGAILIAPLYLRGILYWKKTSFYSILCFCLNFCLTSTIAVICFENVKGSLLDAIWPIKDIKIILLLVALVLNWVGIKAIAGLAYLLLFLLVMLNLSIVNDGMEFNGFMCILFGIIGLITQNGMSPGELFGGLAEVFRKPGSKAKESIAETKRLLK
jgi:hypothetical protein